MNSRLKIAIAVVAALLVLPFLLPVTGWLKWSIFALGVLGAAFLVFTVRQIITLFRRRS